MLQAKYYQELAAYERENSHQKAFLLKPKLPPQLLINDLTVESLQKTFAANGRGAFYLCDELMRFFSFGRYGSGQTAS